MRNIDALKEVERDRIFSDAYREYYTLFGIMTDRFFFGKTKKEVSRMEDRMKTISKFLNTHGIKLPIEYIRDEV